MVVLIRVGILGIYFKGELIEFVGRLDVEFGIKKGVKVFGLSRWKGGVVVY